MKSKIKKVTIYIILPILLFVILLFVGKQGVSYVKNGILTTIDYTVESFQPYLEEYGTQGENNQNVIENRVNINDDLSDIMLELSLGEEIIDIDTNTSNNVLEIDTLYSNQEIPVGIEAVSGSLPEDTSITINNTNIEDIDRLEINSLQKDEYIDFKLQSGDLSRTYYIQTLPDDFPEIEKIGISDYPGVYYTNIYPNSLGRDSDYIVKLSETGEVLYYKRDAINTVMDFERWNTNGNMRQTYFEEFNKAGIAKTTGYGHGEYVVMDEYYSEIDRVEALPSPKYEVFETSIDHHDFIYIDDGHYMVMKYLHTHPKTEHTNDELPVSSNITAAYIQEIKDDEIIWEWSSTDYPEFYEASIEGNDFFNQNSHSADYVHINSMFIDPKDDNLIISLRHQDSVVKINRDNNEIMWALGGENDAFNLSDNQMFSRQHHASFTETGNLILFDNGNKNEQTRVLEFKLDEQNNEVLEFEEFKVDGYFGQYTGSVQKINEENDVFVIGWGLNKNHYNLMSEIDFKNGDVETEVISDNIDDDTYRFLKYPE